MGSARGSRIAQSPTADDKIKERIGNLEEIVSRTVTHLSQLKDLSSVIEEQPLGIQEDESYNKDKQVL